MFWSDKDEKGRFCGLIQVLKAVFPFQAKTLNPRPKTLHRLCNHNLTGVVCVRMGLCSCNSGAKRSLDPKLRGLSSQKTPVFAILVACLKWLVQHECVIRVLLCIGRGAGGLSLRQLFKPAAKQLDFGILQALRKASAHNSGNDVIFCFFVPCIPNAPHPKPEP